MRRWIPLPSLAAHISHRGGPRSPPSLIRLFSVHLPPRSRHCRPARAVSRARAESLLAAVWTGLGLTLALASAAIARTASLRFRRHRAPCLLANKPPPLLVAAGRARRRPPAKSRS